MVMRILLLVLLVIVPLGFSTSRSLNGSPVVGKMGFRVKLRRVDSAGNFTKLELMQRAASRSLQRMQRLNAMTLAALDATVEAPVHAGNGEFLMDLAIGTPPLPYSAVLDTGSDLIWTQCQPCDNCFDQSTPIFDPAKSSSFSTLSCSSQFCSALPTSICSDGGCQYLYTYGDHSSTQGVMGSETFKLNKASLPEISFGCGSQNVGIGFGQGAGIVGLGRGPLSLVSQLDEPKFSYCLTSLDSSASSTLLMGSHENSGGAANTIPMIKSESFPSFYYISLHGISVGNKNLQIDSSTFALKPDGSGGMIIDSGTTLTYLPADAFKAVAEEFTRQINLPMYTGQSTGLDLCFSVTGGSIAVPSVVLHFSGGADWVSAPENLLLSDTDGKVICLAMGSSVGMSILGNVQQQNTWVLYQLH